MKILFVHQNFPAQFVHLAPALAQQGHAVAALTLRKLERRDWRGVRLLSYAIGRGSTAGVHPWVADLETKTIRGEACFRAALAMKSAGYAPDAIIAHPGWGESLFLKDVWPQAKLGIYCEFFYQAQGGDVGFDPEFSPPRADDAPRMRMRNVNNLLHLEIADAGLSPTEWQADSFPERFRPRISIIHDGIDTRRVAPLPEAAFEFPTPGSGLRRLTRQDEVVTFVNRNLEPYRGYHQFMRALPDILRRRPRAQVLIVGGEGVSYGALPDPERFGGRSWKQVFIDEARPKISAADWSRVHFLGKLPYPQFVSLLQVSSVHVYLTYPFVLSWSLLEAMSAGCAIVASDTPPVREAIAHDATGRLVDFFDAQGLGESVCTLLDDPAARARLGEQARRFAMAHYDLETVCLPRQLQWVRDLAGMG